MFANCKYTEKTTTKINATKINATKINVILMLMLQPMELMYYLSRAHEIVVGNETISLSYSLVLMLYSCLFF